MTDALTLDGVSKVYEVGGVEIRALDHVDLSVADGEVVTLLGPSGSGKTTLLSIAGGLLSASSGLVVVGGQDITRARPRQLTAFRRQRVGFIFQAVNLVPFLTARENLLVVSQLAGRGRANALRRADRLLEELGLGHRTGNLPAQLSGGERQRVAIGRALMNAPALVLVDEPTSALDSDLGQQVMELIVAEVKARDAAAVIVTHDARMTRYGDRILNMADGRIASVEPRPEWMRPVPEPASAAAPSTGEYEPAVRALSALAPAEPPPTGSDDRTRRGAQLSGPHPTVPLPQRRPRHAAPPPEPPDYPEPAGLPPEPAHFPEPAGYPGTASSLPDPGDWPHVPAHASDEWAHSPMPAATTDEAVWPQAPHEPLDPYDRPQPPAEPPDPYAWPQPPVRAPAQREGPAEAPDSYGQPQTPATPSHPRGLPRLSPLPPSPPAPPSDPIELDPAVPASAWVTGEMPVLPDPAGAYPADGYGVPAQTAPWPGDDAYTAQPAETAPWPSDERYTDRPAESAPWPGEEAYPAQPADPWALSQPAEAAGWPTPSDVPRPPAGDSWPEPDRGVPPAAAYGAGPVEVPHRPPNRRHLQNGGRRDLQGGEPPAEDWDPRWESPPPAEQPAHWSPPEIPDHAGYEPAHAAEPIMDSPGRPEPWSPPRDQAVFRPPTPPPPTVDPVWGKALGTQLPEPPPAPRLRPPPRVPPPPPPPPPSRRLWPTQQWRDEDETEG